MTKTLIILILLFDGTLTKEVILFPAEGTISDCFNYARMYIDNVSTHSWTDPRGSGQYLNDGTGTIQGFICSK
jgi:hypothetical protein|tara:strand:- start:375 stop:593 length:219 start_codon:yes stop_codon:yes gene_type:complete